MEEISMKRIAWIAAAMVAMTSLAGVQAFAQQPVKVNTKIGRTETFDDVPNKEGLNSADRKFMSKAAVVNMFEIQAGELAKRKGRSSWTKNFGWEMQREHTMAHNELIALADKKNFTLPKGLDKEHKTMLMKLHNAQGTAFDRMYRKMMIAGHTKAEQLAASAVKRGHDTFVRSYANNMVATTNHHQMMAMHGELMVKDPRQTGGRLAQPMKP
jgi:putative membrane protein